MDFGEIGRARRNTMHSFIPLGDTLGGGWIYRCDDCTWQGRSGIDLCECPECGGYTNRAPQSEMALWA